MIPTLVDALRALRPNDSFIVRGEIAYENIQLADKIIKDNIEYSSVISTKELNQKLKFGFR